MRLTKKIDNKYYVIATQINFQKDGDNATQKLGQLEDIEEELGVDLIALLNEHPDAKHLLYNLIHNIPFVFAPKGERKNE